MMTEARLDKSKVPDTYRRIASLYDAWAWLTESKARKRCLELAAIQDGESVLEVAVGTGLAFERILEVNPSGRNEGVDLTDAMLARAERRAAGTGHTNFRLRVGDAYALDFAEPGGRLVMVNMTDGEHWYNGLWPLVYRINPALLGGCRGVTLVPHLEATGFVRIEREYVSQATFPSEVIAAQAATSCS
jgi:SAM-dependent methyltransferase